MQQAADGTIYCALLLAMFAAIASAPRTGPSFDQRIMDLLNCEALAVDMPLASADGEQLFVGP